MTTRRARDGYLPVPGAKLYFREIGEGPPMIVLHGGPDFNHHYLLPELDRLASRFRLVYYDQRGRGKSSSGVVAEDVGMESELEDLARIEAHFNLDPVALAGHSWGGVLAMAYAARHPDRVSRLILVNSAPGSHAGFLRFRSEREAAEAPTLAKMRAIAATPRYAGGDVEAEAEYYRLHFSRTLRRPGQLEAVVRRLRAHFGREDIVKARAIEERLYAQTWLRPEFDLVAPLSCTNVPTLVIHGDQDLIPLECAKAIADAVHGSRLVVLRGCGHFAYLERPGEVTDAIADFIESGPDPPPSAAQPTTMI